MKEDEGVPVTISFNIDSDASERELEKLISIKDDDYTEVVAAINEKAVVRMKQDEREISKNERKRGREKEATTDQRNEKEKQN